MTKDSPTIQRRRSRSGVSVGETRRHRSWSRRSSALGHQWHWAVAGLSDRVSAEHPAIEAGVRGLVSDGSSPESRSLDPGASDLLGPTAGHDRAPTSLLDANASVVFDRAKGRTARRLVTLWLPGQLADGRAGSYRERPPPLTDVLASAVAEAHVDCVGRGGVAGHNVLK